MIFLYGASGHGKVIAEILEITGKKIEAFIDKNDAIKNLLDYPVYSSFPFKDYENIYFIISIGNNEIRKQVVNQLNASYIRAIHPNANLSKRSSVGEGTVVMAGVSVNSSCKIGKHVILNTNCSIDHDCVLEDFVHISPNASLAGNVEIGEGAHVGIGASIIQGIKIGEWSTIGAGAVIIQDVPPFATVVGNPGKISSIRNH